MNLWGAPAEVAGAGAPCLGSLGQTRPFFGLPSLLRDYDILGCQVKVMMSQYCNGVTRGGR